MTEPARWRPTRVALVASAAVTALTAAAFAWYVAPVSARYDPAAAHLAEVRLQRLSDIIGGSVRQRVAGEIVQYHATQDPITDCMSQAGWDYTPPAFVNMYAGRDRLVMDVGRWTAPIRADSLGIADQHRQPSPPGDPPNPGFERLSPAEQDRYSEALTRCMPRGAVDVHFPQSSHRLNNALSQVIAKAEKSLAVVWATRRYEPCMRQAGVPARDYENLHEQLQETLNHAASGTGTPSVPAWQAAVDRERTAASADARCRSDIRGLALARVGSMLDRFEADHAADLIQVQQDWDALIAQAMTYPEGDTHLG